MANAVYQLGLQAFLEGSVAWLTDTIKAALVTNSYTPNTTTDQYYNIIPGGAILKTATLGTKTSTLGTAGAANTTFATVTSGSTGYYVVIYKSTGTDSTSPLLFIFDTATNLPVVTNGGDIVVQWASGQIVTLCEGLSESERGLVVGFLEWLRGVFNGRCVSLGGGGRLPLFAPRVISEGGI